MINSFYKKYNREQRTITSEETFQKGMYFTKAPLNTSETRLLVNYDITSEGESLSPRKGLRVSEVCLPFDSDLKPTLKSDLTIKQVKDVITANNKHYRLIATDKYANNDTAVSGTNLSEAYREIWVVREDEASKEILDEYNVETKRLYSIPASFATIVALPYDSAHTYNKGDQCYETASSTIVMECKEDGVTGTWDSTKWQIYVYPKSYYYTPNNVKVHGMTLTNKKYISRPVGCFIEKDGAYYNFNNKKEFIRTRYDSTENIYYTQKIIPKVLDASAAYNHGFNMLLEEPFIFSNIRGSGNIYFSGIMVYDTNNSLNAYPLINSPYNLKLYYTAASSKNYKIEISWAIKGNTDYTKILTKEIATGTSGDLPAIEFNGFTASASEIVFKVQAFLKSGSSYSTTAETDTSFTLYFSEEGSTSRSSGTTSLKYDLSKCSNMCFWRNRIWLYGLVSNQNKIFYSEYDEINYFPVPHNVMTFDEPVLYCTPFNDTLLVFTSSQIIQITATTDSISSATKKVIQSNLDFNEFNVSLIQTVKNMLFFQSGEYYYMVVPKTLSLQNELAIAPISKTIETFLDNFSSNAKSLIELVYGYTGTLTLEHHYNFLNYEDVCNMYVFNTSSGLLINMGLLYNTVDRTWRISIYESQSIGYPIKQDATKISTIVTPLIAKINIDGTETTEAGIQFLENSENSLKDFYIPTNSIFTKTNGIWVADGGVIQEAFDDIHTYKNYQLLDTGYRNMDIDHNKRLRELQFKFNNVSGANIKFTTEFILDGETRINKYNYVVEQNVDPSSPNYGLIYIDKIPVENIELPSTTTLAYSALDINAWTLDNSRFPEIAYWKAKLKVSGKGYTPRFRLISRDEEQYEFLGYTWVYRTMYAR